MFTLKELIYISLFLLFCPAAGSQHLFPVYSQYMLNGLALNPAYAGSREVLNVTLGYRNQWVGFEGAPVSQTFGAHTPLKKEKIALGIFLHNEQIDVRNNTSFYFNYAYRATVGKGRLSLGLKAGGMNRNFNWNKLSLHDPGDIVFSSPGKSEMLPNFGFGAYYYTQSYFFGASIPLFLSDSTRNSKAVSYHDMSRYNYLISGGLVTGQGSIKVKPSFLLKYSAENPVQIDANLSFIFSDLVWLGMSYRIHDALVGLFKLQLTDQFRIGYTYDYSIGHLNRFSNGSHEVVLIYDFRFRVNAVNPRYF
jgi:type IX secretion system PorP/SprF family membrane protein